MIVRQKGIALKETFSLPGRLPERRIRWLFCTVETYIKVTTALHTDTRFLYCAIRHSLNHISILTKRKQKKYFKMRFTQTAVAAAVAVGSASAQRPSNTSICDYYTTALLKENTADNQATLLTLVVNTVVIGNCKLITILYTTYLKPSHVTIY